MQVARLYQRAFAAVLCSAWVSLALQVPWLIGSRGLLPAATLFERTAESGGSWLDAPSLLWLAHGDLALSTGAWLGAALAACALAGYAPRICFAFSAPLYLSYAIACDDFTAFQWDNMLVEVALLSAFLPSDRPAPLVRFAFRLLIFKLYFESGLAKWQSHLHDWQNGSAMTFYYETAPLPGPLAWHAHHLPTSWHHVESWGALALELIVPFFVLGPRPTRLIAFASLTGFQIVNTATANYGFFTYLSVALHVLLLDERDVLRVRAWLRMPQATLDATQLAAGHAATTPLARVAKLAPFATPAALCIWLLASVMGGALRFAPSEAVQRAFGKPYALIAPFRVANIYQLFGHITQERIEPQLELRVHGAWREQDLRWKPGDVMRAPPLVAPHQPRVDFRLWFYGLSFQRGMPEYVHNLLARVCSDREIVQPLFEAPLPAAVEAVRVAFFKYRFSSPEQRAQTGAYWARERLGALPERTCP